MVEDGHLIYRLVMDWHWIDIRLVQDWHPIGMDLHRIGIGLTADLDGTQDRHGIGMDWHRIGRIRSGWL